MKLWFIQPCFTGFSLFLHRGERTPRGEFEGCGSLSCENLSRSFEINKWQSLKVLSYGEDIALQCENWKFYRHLYAREARVFPSNMLKYVEFLQAEIHVSIKITIYLIHDFDRGKEKKDIKFHESIMSTLFYFLNKI